MSLCKHGFGHGFVGDAKRASLCLLCLFLAGTVLGILLPPSDKLHGTYRRVSAIIGWTYFCSWSISFYPQVYLNARRRTTLGLSFDFQLFNLLGFSCYSAFTAAFFWSGPVQEEYRNRHDGRSNKVELNDVIFACHAAAITAITLLQIMWYDWGEPKLQRPSRSASLVCTLAVFCSGAYALLVWALGDHSRPWTWVDFLYVLSYIKIGVSVVKYFPQVLLNFRRRSTVGWNIWNVIFDFVGGLLSVLQLVLDCYFTGDWSGILGFPVKFALGFVCVFFDLIFMLQHYVLYPARDVEPAPEVRRPLLSHLSAIPSVRADSLNDGDWDASAPHAHAVRGSSDWDASDSLPTWARPPRATADSGGSGTSSGAAGPATQGNGSGGTYFKL